MATSFGIFERMRWMSALAGAAILMLFVLVGAHAQAPSLSIAASAPAPVVGGSTAPLDPRIATLAARHPAARIEAIVQFDRGVTPSRARTLTQRAGGRVVGAVQIINGLAVELTAAQARGLAASSAVHSVTLNTEVSAQGGPDLGRPERWRQPRGQVSNLATTYDETLGATDLWRAGADGSGVGVAVIDTGVDGQLPDFRSDSGDSRVVATAVTNPAAKTVYDTYGHGTDVAGIIAGNGGNRDASDPLRGQYVGVAPEANLIAIKASDDQGNASVLDVIYGIEFAIAHQQAYNIRVINLSLSSSTPQSYKVDPLDAAVEAAWAHGIVVVAAAGNRGDVAGAEEYAPANDPYVITVGGTDENGSADAAGDTIASWSSRGVTQDGFQKPDVYAPGAHIVSILAPDSKFAQECPTCIIDGQYIRASGTSMAAPMISGLVADVLSKHPELTPDQVKGALTDPYVRALDALQEPNAVKVALDYDPQPADQGLTPSQLITSSGDVAGDWSFSSWATAQGALKAPFAFSSWACASCDVKPGGAVQPNFSAWSFASWSTIQDR